MDSKKQTLGEITAEAVNQAGRAAKHLTYLSRRRARILQEQERIRRLYARLGKVYYKDYVTDEEPDEAEYLPLCDAISAAYRRINALREEIAAEKDAYAAGNGVPTVLPCEDSTETDCETEEKTEEKTEE